MPSSDKPTRVATRHRWLKRFWVANFPLCLGLYVLAPDKVTLLYLALVSVYANFASEAAVQQAAESRGGKDGD